MSITAVRFKAGFTRALDVIVAEDTPNRDPIDKGAVTNMLYEVLESYPHVNRANFNLLRDDFFAQIDASVAAAMTSLAQKPYQLNSRQSAATEDGGLSEKVACYAKAAFDTLKPK